MNTLRPVFFNRDFSRRAVQHPGLPVAKAAWRAVGGCDRALLLAEGQELGLPELISLLRCPVQLVDESGTPAWWGFVNGFRSMEKGRGVGACLDQMANRVRALYRAPGTPPSETWSATAWMNDLDSQAVYGIKERLLRLPCAGPEQAQAASQAELVESAWPVLGPCEPDGPDGWWIDLKSWWHTLAWRYYDQPAGLEEHAADGRGVQAVGSAAACTKAAQQIHLSAGNWQAASVRLRVRRAGSPADALQVDLCAESGGAPGSSLGSTQAAAANVPADYAWLKLDFSSPPSLPAEVCWLVVSRSGALDSANYYSLLLDEALGFAGGAARLWNGSAWVARSPDADLLFRLEGRMETTDQIAQALAAGGQFLSGVLLDPLSGGSGVFDNPWRDGSRTVLDEVKDLLAAGDENGRRLVAEVNGERLVEVYRPWPGSAPFLRINPAGAICNKYGQALKPWFPAASHWACLDQLPAGVGSSQARIANRVFLDRVAWDPEAGVLRQALDGTG